MLQVHDLESGKFLYKVPLAIGSIDGVHGRKKSNELFFKFSSMVNPGVIYFLDMSQESPVPQVSRFFFLSSRYSFTMCYYSNTTEWILNDIKTP